MGPPRLRPGRQPLPAGAEAFGAPLRGDVTSVACPTVTCRFGLKDRGAPLSGDVEFVACPTVAGRIGRGCEAEVVGTQPRGCTELVACPTVTAARGRLRALRLVRTAAPLLCNRRARESPGRTQERGADRLRPGGQGPAAGTQAGGTHGARTGGLPGAPDRSLEACPFKHSNAGGRASRRARAMGGYPTTARDPRRRPPHAGPDLRRPAPRLEATCPARLEATCPARLEALCSALALAANRVGRPAPAREDERLSRRAGGEG